MTLKTQPTKLPTRKIAAVIISGAVLGGAQAALDMFWPDHPFAPLMEQADIWLQLGIMALAGYMVRDKA